MGILKKNKTSRFFSGFTIVEVMIVLAIAGLILLVVFIAVPSLQQSRRDSYRKNYANLLLSKLIEFQGNNTQLPYCGFVGVNNSAPHCTQAHAIATRFLTSYLPEGEDPSTGESYSSNSTHQVAGPVCYGTTTNSGNVSYCWDDRVSAVSTQHHQVFPPVGEIVIKSGHQCRYGSTDSIRDDPEGAPFLAVDFVVIIGVEKGRHYCVYNGGK